MTTGGTLIAIVGVLIAAASGGAAPEARGVDSATDAYGGTPDELLPYRQTRAYSWRFYDESPRYRGPGREERAPAGLESVKIGLIAPIESEFDAAIGEAMLHGATLAFEEANANGGFRDSIPFELIVRNDSGLWGTTSNTLVELAYDDEVWGIVGSVDGGNTHVALRVALKAEVPMVNTSCTDPTLTETAIPWILRCYPDDRQHGYRLAQLLIRERSYDRIAVLRSNDKYGRMGIAEFRDAARRLGTPILLEVRHSPGETSFGGQLERIRKIGADAVVLWTNAVDAGRIVAEMRAAGMEQPVFGNDRLVSHEFLEVAAGAADGIVATCPLDPTRGDADWHEFRSRFERRYEEAPDVFAVFTYDGTRLMLEAVRRAGLNRALIRDELAAIETYEGVAGTMQFDTTHNNLGSLSLLEVRDGEFQTLVGY